jgi:hypothetical protein
VRCAGEDGGDDQVEGRLMASATFSIVISLAALCLSFIAFWKNQLAPFKLWIANDGMTFRLYKIHTWWIPSIDIGFTFCNTGTKAGEVRDIRLRTELTGKSEKLLYPFYAKWIVDYAKFQKHGSDRFEWLDDGLLRDWYPVLLKGGEQLHLHIILEGIRWDAKLEGQLSCVLEIYSSDTGKWKEHSRYSLNLEARMFDRTDSYTFQSPRLVETRTDMGDWPVFNAPRTPPAPGIGTDTPRTT